MEWNSMTLDGLCYVTQWKRTHHTCKGLIHTHRQKNKRYYHVSRTCAHFLKSPQNAEQTLLLPASGSTRWLFMENHSAKSHGGTIRCCLQVIQTEKKKKRTKKIEVRRWGRSAKQGLQYHSCKMQKKVPRIYSTESEASANSMFF